jgi:hypothetical protein
MELLLSMRPNNKHQFGNIRAPRSVFLGDDIECHAASDDRLNAEREVLEDFIIRRQGSL